MSVFLLVVLIAAAGFYAATRLGGHWLARHERQWIDRFDNGLCLHCGYDKRIDPRGRCPECGRY